MSQHYYEANPTTASQRKRWSYTLRERVFHFWSDTGVFSKNTVDFGSELLINSIDETIPVKKLLDMGCGYGPIGLTLASVFPKATVEMVDVNERALELAKENAQLNQVQNVSIYQSNQYEAVQTDDFDLIVSNPPIRAGKQVVHEMIAQALNHLAPGGRLVIVIQKKQGAPSAEKKMQEVFGQVSMIQRSKGYWILESVKE